MKIHIQEIDIAIVETRAEVEMEDKGLGLTQGIETIVEQGLDQAHM